MSSHIPSLIILAGGLGSRFGGNKQITLLPGINKTIMQLTIEDAYDAGIRHVVIVIHPAIVEQLKHQVLVNLPNEINVEIALQRIEDVPAAFAHMTASRDKPWGTGHALLSARHLISGKAIVVTADDYYGRNAFFQMTNHFAHSHHWACVAYPLANTLSQQGTVNRGVCEVSSDNTLVAVEEHQHIESNNGKTTAVDASNRSVVLPDNTLVSMTFWGVDAQFFQVLEHNFRVFLQMIDSVQQDEYFLPDQIQFCIDSGVAKVVVYTATENWIGMTYKEELATVSNAISDYRASV